MNKFVICLFAAVLLVCSVSCRPGEKTGAAASEFGIYQVIKRDDIPQALIDTLEKLNVIIEADSLRPFLCYITVNDTLVLKNDFSEYNLRLVKTYNTVDDAGKYYALVAISPSPFINGADVQKTLPDGNNVEIRFNMQGAEKWAEMTSGNIGNSVAFLVDGEIYAIPVVNAEIRSGVALINGLENADVASELSASLNGE